MPSLIQTQSDERAHWYLQEISQSKSRRRRSFFQPCVRPTEDSSEIRHKRDFDTSEVFARVLGKYGLTLTNKAKSTISHLLCLSKMVTPRKKKKKRRNLFTGFLVVTAPPRILWKPETSRNDHAGISVMLKRNTEQRISRAR